MSKLLWHTLTISIPDEMAIKTKTGKISKRQTLTKLNNLSKSYGYLAIKLVKSQDNKVHVINEGQEIKFNKIKSNLIEDNTDLDDNPYSLTILEQKYCNSIKFDYTDPKIFRPLNIKERSYLRKKFKLSQNEEETLSDKLSKKPGIGFGLYKKYINKKI